MARILNLIFVSYSLLGLTFVLLSDWQLISNQIIYSIVYALLPLLGVVALYKKSKLGLLLQLILFSFIGIRIPSLIPNSLLAAPISVAFPVGDFVQGAGALIDLFAIMVTILIAIVIYQLNHEKMNEPKPTK